MQSPATLRTILYLESLGQVSTMVYYLVLLRGEARHVPGLRQRPLAHPVRHPIHSPIGKGELHHLL